MSRKKLTINETFPGLPARIKKIRADRGQAEFAEMIGVSKPTVSKYEAGKSQPPKETLEKIALIGNTSVDWLLKGEEKTELQEAQTPWAKPVPGDLGPAIYAGVDTTVLAQILASVEILLEKRKRKISAMRKAHLVSLLYDRYQETGRVPEEETIRDMLRLVI
jgi:transcriptional regulator with XRE-family HTH domain